MAANCTTDRINPTCLHPSQMTLSSFTAKEVRDTRALLDSKRTLIGRARAIENIALRYVAIASVAFLYVGSLSIAAIFDHLSSASLKQVLAHLVKNNKEIPKQPLSKALKYTLATIGIIGVFAAIYAVSLKQAAPTLTPAPKILKLEYTLPQNQAPSPSQSRVLPFKLADYLPGEKSKTPFSLYKSVVRKLPSLKAHVIETSTKEFQLMDTPTASLFRAPLKISGIYMLPKVTCSLLSLASFSGATSLPKTHPITPLKILKALPTIIIPSVNAETYPLALPNMLAPPNYSTDFYPQSGAEFENHNFLNSALKIAATGLLYLFFTEKKENNPPPIFREDLSDQQKAPMLLLKDSEVKPAYTSDQPLSIVKYEQPFSTSQRSKAPMLLLEDRKASQPNISNIPLSILSYKEPLLIPQKAKAPILLLEDIKKQEEPVTPVEESDLADIIDEATSILAATEQELRDAEPTNFGGLTTLQSAPLSELSPTSTYEEDPSNALLRDISQMLSATAEAVQESLFSVNENSRSSFLEENRPLPAPPEIRLAPRLKDMARAIDKLGSNPHISESEKKQIKKAALRIGTALKKPVNDKTKAYLDRAAKHLGNAYIAIHSGDHTQFAESMGKAKRYERKARRSLAPLKTAEKSKKAAPKYAPEKAQPLKRTIKARTTGHLNERKALKPSIHGNGISNTTTIAV